MMIYGKEQFMFSMICVYNNKDIFKANLLKSIKMQNINVEIIPINNTNNSYK